MSKKTEKTVVKHHYTVSHYIWNTLKYLILIFFAFASVLPIASCVITAFKTDQEYQSTNVMVMPHSRLNFANFAKAKSKAECLFFGNAIYVTTGWALDKNR